VEKRWRENGCSYGSAASDVTQRLSRPEIDRYSLQDARVEFSSSRRALYRHNLCANYRAWHYARGGRLMPPARSRARAFRHDATRRHAR